MDKTFIRAATALIMSEALEELKVIGDMHELEHDIAYVDNMLCLSVVAYCLSTNTKRDELIAMMSGLAAQFNKEEESDIINKAKELL